MTKFLTHNSVWEIDEELHLFLRYPREDATERELNDLPYTRELQSFSNMDPPIPVSMVGVCRHHHVRIRLHGVAPHGTLKFDPIMPCPNDTDGDGNCWACA